MPIRLVLADDHPIVLQGLEQLFLFEADFAVVACVTNGAEALQAVRTHQPNILVLDLRMPVMDGLAVVREINRDALPTKVVVLTAIEGDDVLEAIELGVRGVVLKDMALQLLVRAVREVHAGGTWIERNAATNAVDRLLQRNAGIREIAATLTPREMEVARMIAQGVPNKMVAHRLRITEGTAKLHLHHVYEKLGLDGRMALARYLQSKGLD
jgi:DNA-binding NarL/FixJ family response regulator